MSRQGYKSADFTVLARDQTGRTSKVSAEDQNLVLDLSEGRARIEYLEQDLSEALHLFYAVLTWIFGSAPEEFLQRMRRQVHAKFHQMPQGCRIGQQLIELDAQSGGLLETHGVWLSRWVYEPREKCSG